MDQRIVSAQREIGRVPWHYDGETDRGYDGALRTVFPAAGKPTPAFLPID